MVEVPWMSTVIVNEQTQGANVFRTLGRECQARKRMKGKEECGRVSKEMSEVGREKHGQVVIFKKTS